MTKEERDNLAARLRRMSEGHKQYQNIYHDGVAEGFLKAAVVVEKMESEKAPNVGTERVGTWEITNAYPHNVYCSECHIRFAQIGWSVWKDGSLPRNFCPNCGARMEGVNDE